MTRLDASNTQMSAEGLSKFASKSQHKLKVYGKVVDRRQSGRSSGGTARKRTRLLSNAPEIYENYDDDVAEVVCMST